MSYSSKRIKRDADQKPIPQYFNPNTDDYEALQGKNGAYNVNVLESALPAGAATDAKLDLILSKLEDVESELTAIKSTNGIKKIEDTVAVQLTGSSLPDTQALPVKQAFNYELETIINAESVPSNQTSFKIITTNGEAELWFLVSIDKQPWRLTAGTPWFTQYSWGPQPFFPVRNNVANTSTVSVPIISLYVPLSPSLSSLGLTAPTTMAEARQFLTPPPKSFGVGVHNGSAETATVTLKVLRVWRS